MQNSILLTEIQEDWCQRNINALQASLRETEVAMLGRTDIEADPLLDSPNLPNLRGYMRWAILPKIIQSHVAAGRYAGISGSWVPLGGVSVFELESDCTTLTAFHLKHEDEVPRESFYRKNKRRLNAGPQMGFPYYDVPARRDDSDNPRTHLTLVYGGEEEFAYLRAYFDEENRSYYHKLSGNIMNMPMLLSSVETELVADPQIELGLRLKTKRFDKPSA